MSERLFGTDGIRGVANTELTPLLAYKLGIAAARVLGKSHTPTFVIGRDTRISGTLLESALSAGICSMGGLIVSPGVIPTPAVAAITRTVGFDAGIVISASHNPFQDNGIKFFGADGYKLEDQIEDEIAAVVKVATDIPGPSGKSVGYIRRDPSLRALYADQIKEAMGSTRLEGIKTVIDASNGANSLLAPRVFSDLGADVISLHCAPDGLNINANCGSLHPEEMIQRTINEGADIGVAFDGDADRVILCDEKGNLVDGDKIMLLIGRHLMLRGELRGNAVVGTIMSNMGLEVALRENGIDLIRTAVGDRYVCERMRKDGFVLGGEKSGHIIFGNLSTTGDGLLTVLQVIKVMRETGKTLSALADQMHEYPQVLISIKVKDRQSWKHDEVIMRAIHDAEQTLAGRGRINVRASGTEKLIRVMAEGPDQDEIDAIVHGIGALIKDKAGA